MDAVQISGQRATAVAPRPRRCRFTRRDWTGDCIITIAGGLVLLAGVVLPWANDDAGHQVNLSLTRPGSIRPALATDWGVTVLILGVAVLALGAMTLALGPKRLAVPCGAATAIAGVAVVAVDFRAAASMAPSFTPGLGIYIDVLAGILLVPTGFASAVVGHVLSAEARDATRARRAGR
jgi:hypothetical protein